MFGFTGTTGLYWEGRYCLEQGTALPPSMKYDYELRAAIEIRGNTAYVYKCIYALNNRKAWNDISVLTDTTKYTYKGTIESEDNNVLAAILTDGLGDGRWIGSNENYTKSQQALYYAYRDNGWGKNLMKQFPDLYVTTGSGGYGSKTIYNQYVELANKKEYSVNIYLFHSDHYQDILIAEPQLITVTKKWEDYNSSNRPKAEDVKLKVYRQIPEKTDWELLTQEDDYKISDWNTDNTDEWTCEISIKENLYSFKDEDGKVNTRFL